MSVVYLACFNISLMWVGSVIIYFCPYSLIPIFSNFTTDLYDITDFGILRPTANRHHANSSDGGDGWGDLMGEEYDHNNLSSPGGRAAVPKSASSSSLSQPKLRRRSSFARVFSSLGMSSSIVEDDNVANITSGPDESGGLLDDSSETNRLSLLPPRFRRGSSVGLDALHHQRRSSMESIGGMRDRLFGNIGIRNNSRIPKWAIHTATLLHQHSLLHDNNLRVFESIVVLSMASDIPLKKSGHGISISCIITISRFALVIATCKGLRSEYLLTPNTIT